MPNLFKNNNDKNEKILQMSDSEMLSFKLAGRPNKNEQHSGDLDENGLEIFYYDANTFHGMHYTKEEFEAEVLNRYTNFCNDFPAQAAETEITPFVYRTFMDWNDNNDERAKQFMRIRDVQEHGFINVTSEDEMPDEEIWQPVNGISLLDYAHSIYVANKYSEITNAQLAEALGVELPVFDESKKIWNERIMNKNIFNVYMNFQQLPIENEGLKKIILEGDFRNFTSETSPSNDVNDNVNRILNENHFYLEISGLMISSDEYGVDPVQYLQENYQISIMDYTEGSQNFDKRNFGMSQENMDIMMAFKEHFDKIFSDEMGGNIADDIKF